MEIELIEVEITNEDGAQKFTFQAIFNNKEYQSAMIICNSCDMDSNDFIVTCIESVIKQFEEFEKKLNKR